MFAEQGSISSGKPRARPYRAGRTSPLSLPCIGLHDETQPSTQAVEQRGRDVCDVR